jgi:Flp pilus assembly protein protease CpaA
MTHVTTGDELQRASSASCAERPRLVSGSAVVATATAALVVACLFWTAGHKPLPSLGGAAAFLFLAIHQDVFHLRIPNWLTLPSLGLALAASGVAGGTTALVSALAGAGTALAVTFVPFALRWLGGGDVKASLVLGALWGSGDFLCAFWWMVIIGGVLAVMLVAAQGGLPDLLRRWLNSARLTLASRRLTYIGAPAHSLAHAGLPFAVCMGLGAAAYQLWGTPWS